MFKVFILLYRSNELTFNDPLHPNIKISIARGLGQAESCFCRFYSVHFPELSFFLLFLHCMQIPLLLFFISHMTHTLGTNFPAIVFNPAEFTPDGVLSSLYSYVRPSVRPYVRPSEIFFEIFGFLGSSRW